MEYTYVDLERWEREERRRALETVTKKVNAMVNGVLDLDGLDLRSLPPLPEGVRVLLCQENHLTALPALPSTLEVLDCGVNYDLTALPALLHTALKVLRCNNNKLTTLPALPPTLTVLDCHNNELTSLPPLPPTLTELVYWGNKLTSLPPLSPTLTKLDCHNNELTALPPLPPTLTELDCRRNNLTALPALLPRGLKKLYCNFNELTTLPPLPDTLTELYCHGNPFIKPFQELTDSYRRAAIDLPTLISRINTLNAEIASLQSQGRNLRTMNILRRQRWDPTKTTINMGNVLEGNVGTLVSSMLTGREGSTEQQMTLLKGNAAQLGLPETTVMNIEKAYALKKLQNQRKKGGSKKKTKKSRKTRKTKKE